MREKGAKHNEGISKHMVNICRTTVRMDADLWSEFKKEVYSAKLTTCLVIRGLVHEWIDEVRALKRHTETENVKEPFGISRFKHEEKRERWIYSKMTQTLYDPKLLAGRLRSRQRERLQRTSRYRGIV